MFKFISPSTDSQGVTLYAPTTASSQLAFPVIATSSGCLMVSEGLDIPAYDAMVLSYAGSNVTGIQYFTGGTAGTLVATLSITYNGSNIATLQRS